MFNKGEYIIYKRDVCIIKDIKEKYFEGSNYYVLSPLEDGTLTIDVPVEDKAGNLRPIISKEEAEKIISNIPNVELINTNDRVIENEYRKLISSSNHEDLIKVIKTTYLRNDDRKNAGKKIGDTDNNYFIKAEKYLYNELAIALNMSYIECREYVINRLNELNK